MKYEFSGKTTNVLGRTLYQIQAIRMIRTVGFHTILPGELGGWIEKEENLSQEGNAWVGENAKVFDKARVCDNALVLGDAQINGNARIFGDAQVLGHAKVYGFAQIFGYVLICGNTRVCDHAKIFESAQVYDQAHISDYAQISGAACVKGAANISGDARISNDHHLAVFSYVGSTRGTLTVYRTINGELRVNRGCFYGTLEQFESAVKEKHEGTRYEKEYLNLIEFIKIRFDVVS